MLILAFGLAWGCVSSRGSANDQRDKPPGIDGTAIDPAINPCDDFYKYACGGWIARTPIPEDRPQWSRGFTVIQERNIELLQKILKDYSMGAKTPDNPYRDRLGDFYATCMDESKAETASMATLDDWARGIDALQDSGALAPLLAKLHLAGVNALFQFYPEQDFRDPDQMIAAADQGGLGLPDRDFYLKTDARMREIRRLYRDHVKRMFTLWGAPAAEARKAAELVLRIETELAKASMSRVEQREPEKTYHRLEKAGLEKLAPKMIWARYLELLGYPKITAIDVKAPKFFSAINELISGTPVGDLRAYLRWHLLSAATPALSKRFVDEQFRFSSKALSGQAKIAPRWKRCVQAAGEAMGFALGRSFVELTYGKGGKQESEDMIKSVEDSFGSNIEHTSWMDPPTRSEALRKLGRVVNNVGYPDHWRNYDPLKIDRTSDLANRLAAAEFESRYQLNKIGKPVDKTDWDMPPAAVNAYYDPSMNKMVFPAGILQDPFFAAKAPDFDNYSGIGMVMGHELTHGFDDEGRKFDAKGRLRNWWTPNVLKEFDRRAKCVVKQYSSYAIDQGLHINGALTAGENIADMGGIKASYAAWRATHADATPDQLRSFFIHFAQSWCAKTKPALERVLITIDPHSPPRFRVNGPLTNFPEFAAAFACPLGSKMNKPDRCVVW